MGFSNNSNTGNTQFWKLKIEDQKNPYFVRQENVNGVWSMTEEKYDFFEGTLTDAEIRSYEYKGDLKYSLSLTFSEIAGETYKIGINLNSLAKNIINTFSNAAEKGGLFGKKINFSVWTDGEYARIATRIDGERGDWKFGPDKIKGMSDQRWIDMFDHYIGKQLEEFKKKDDEPMEVAMAEAVMAPPAPTAEDDDLPF